jgi:hypothetical protein
MVALPSIARTEKIREVSEQLNLVEPYRLLNPNKKDYTHIPFALNNMNRSRLDFFLVSNELMQHVSNCEILHALSSMLLDHKQIFLSLGKCKLTSRPVIKDIVLKDKDTQFHVQCGIIETYLQHSTANDRFSIEERQTLLTNIGRIMNNLREINLLELNMAKNGINDMEDLRVAGLRAEVRLLFDDMPELGFFENLELMCDDVVFFEALANCTRNNVLSHQATIYKLKNARKHTLTLEIENLKMNFDANK